MAKSDSELLLSEIAKKLRTLQCICENTANSGGAIVKDYQPLDCNGDPIGSPLNVMPTISVAKQDVSLCNYQQLADAINLGETIPYNIPVIWSIGPDSSGATGLDMSKTHSLSFTIIGTTGTVTFSGNLGDGSQSLTGIPTGVSFGIQATTVFAIGDITITTTGDATVIITAMQSV